MFRIHTEPEGKYGVWRKQYTLILGAALQKRAPPSPPQAPTGKSTVRQHIFIFIAWNNKLNQLNYSPYGRSWCARLQATNKKQNIMLDSYLSMVDTLQCNWCISLTKRCCAGSHRITCMSLDFLWCPQTRMTCIYSNYNRSLWLSHTKHFKPMSCRCSSFQTAMILTKSLVQILICVISLWHFCLACSFIAYISYCNS